AVSQHFAIIKTRDVYPLIDLAPPGDKPSNLHSPWDIAGYFVAKLSQRDSDFRRPALGVSANGAVPCGIPIPIDLIFRIIARPDAVSLNAGGAHFEMPGAAAISASIEVEPNCVRKRVPVATGRGRHDGFRIRVEATDAEIDRVVVVEDPDLGFLARVAALIGCLLGKIGKRDRVHPDRIREISVDFWRPRGARGDGNLFWWRQGRGVPCDRQRQREKP